MSEQVLQQHEIDQLVQAILERKVATGPESLAHLQHVQPLDLGDTAWSQDRIIRRRLPVLDLVFDRLGPSIQVTLTKSLKSPVRTEDTRVELQKFGDFRSQFGSESCLFEVMRLDPLRGYSVLVIEPALLYSLVDALMGGLGIAELPGNRDISDIEVGLLYKVHSELLRDLENAWKPWFPLRVEHVRSDRSSQVISTIDDEEVCHIATINVSGDVFPTSTMRFVLPYASLEPLLEATSARAGDEIDPNWRINLERNIHDVEASVRVVLGQTQLPTSRIRSLQDGDIIELENRTDENVAIHVEGQRIFEGRVGRSRNQYAVQITRRRTIERQLVDRTAGQTLVRKGLISHEQLAVARVDELINRRPLLDSIVARGWVERRVLEHALGHNI